MYMGYSIFLDKSKKLIMYRYGKSAPEETLSHKPDIWSDLFPASGIMP